MLAKTTALGRSITMRCSTVGLASSLPSKMGSIAHSDGENKADSHEKNCAPSGSAGSCPLPWDVRKVGFQLSRRRDNPDRPILYGVANFHVRRRHGMKQVGRHGRTGRGQSSAFTVTSARFPGPSRLDPEAITLCGVNHGGGFLDSPLVTGDPAGMIRLTAMSDRCKW